MKRIQRIARLATVAMAILGGTVSSAFALDLDTARAKGVAGEVDNGFLAVPPGASGEAQELIAKLNNERRKEYVKVASDNNTSLDAIGTIMWLKIYDRIPVGTWIKVQGKWTKKR